eukprot:92387-Pelagomonas_calceolata.AAC.2
MCEGGAKRWETPRGTQSAYSRYKAFGTCQAVICTPYALQVRSFVLFVRNKLCSICAFVLLWAHLAPVCAALRGHPPARMHALYCTPLQIHQHTRWALAFPSPFRNTAMSFPPARTKSAMPALAGCLKPLIWMGLIHYPAPLQPGDIKKNTCIPSNI